MGAIDIIAINSSLNDGSLVQTGDLRGLSASHEEEKTDSLPHSATIVTRNDSAFGNNVSSAPSAFSTGDSSPQRRLRPDHIVTDFSLLSQRSHAWAKGEREQRVAVASKPAVGAVPAVALAAAGSGAAMMSAASADWSGADALCRDTANSAPLSDGHQPLQSFISLQDSQRPTPRQSLRLAARRRKADEGAAETAAPRRWKPR